MVLFFFFLLLNYVGSSAIRILQFNKNDLFPTIKIQDKERLLQCLILNFIKFTNENKGAEKFHYSR